MPRIAPRYLPALVMILALGGCGLWQDGPPDAHTRGRFQGTRVRLETTAALCDYLRVEPDRAGAVRAELGQRQGWALTDAGEEGLAVPAIGSSDASTFCQWGAPDEITKELSRDGRLRELWRYDASDLVMVFQQGRLQSVAHTGQ